MSRSKDIIKGPFALDDNSMIFLSSCANSYIGGNAIHL